MLKRLTVENYALIDSLEVIWDSHLNIITGETGAGKSILLGALQLLLGARCDSSTLKDNSRNCVVEALFTVSIPSLKDFFEENDIEEDENLIVRRIISPSGKSRAFINDIPVQMSTLKHLSSLTIDIHSQHENLIIGSPAFRLQAVDTMAQCQNLVHEHRQIFAQLSDLKSRLEKVKRENEAFAAEHNWLLHETEELESFNLREGETEELEQEIRILENADLIRSTLYTLKESLDGNEQSVIPVLKEQLSHLGKIAQHYSSDYVPRLRSVEIELKDIASSAAIESENIESDPLRLDEATDRLSRLYSLEQKHKVNSEKELISLRDTFRSKLQSMERSSVDIDELEKQIHSTSAATLSLADKIHACRMACCKEFAGEVEKILRKVGLQEATISIDLIPIQHSSEGYDQAEFMFSPLHSSVPYPIGKIASGGEMARVMLAIKSVLARKLDLPTIIFDEIDTGVSGPIANAVGEVVNTLSHNMQVINITHLPQVASKGDSHMLVYKSNGRTSIRHLNSEERIIEIAKMLSADRITDEAIAQAKNLLSIK